MKIVSFNINGLRARLHQLAELVDRYQPDIIGLQEIKVDDDAFPLSDVQALGYHVVHHGQKGHYGVALLSRQAPIQVTKGFPGDTPDAQRRLVTCVYETPDGPLSVINGYFPQGENRSHEVKFPLKEKFYADLQQWLTESYDPQQSLVVMGDVNIAPLDADIGIGAHNAKRWLKTGKCAFLPEERDWMARLQGWGLQDAFRVRYPDVTDRFSWFDYRSRGFEDSPRRGLRIDLLLMTQPLIDRLVDTGIAYDIRAMEKPSDHCPVWAELA